MNLELMRLIDDVEVDLRRLLDWLENLSFRTNGAYDDFIVTISTNFDRLARLIYSRRLYER